MGFKIKQIYRKPLLFPVIFVVITVIAVLLIPNIEHKILAGCIGAVLWLISVIIAVISYSASTYVTVGKSDLVIKHVFSRKTVRISSIISLDYGHYSVTHYVKSRGSSYEEYRVNLAITVMGKDGSYDIMLNDAAFRMKKGVLETAGFSSSERIADENVPLYSVYKLLERRVQEMKAQKS